MLAAVHSRRPPATAQQALPSTRSNRPLRLSWISVFLLGLGICLGGGKAHAESSPHLQGQGRLSVVCRSLSLAVRSESIQPWPFGASWAGTQRTGWLTGAASSLARQGWSRVQMVAASRSVGKHPARSLNRFDSKHATRDMLWPL